MKLKTLSKIEKVFDVINMLVLLVPILLGIILGYVCDGLKWLCYKLDFRLEVGNKLLKISNEVKNGTIKNQDFIDNGRAIAGYKILKYEQSKARNCSSEIFMEE